MGVECEPQHFKTQSRGRCMSVNNLAPNFMRQSGVASSGQRLYLREEELDGGLTRLFEAVFAIKQAAIGTCATLGLNWTQGRVLAALIRTAHGVQSLSLALGLTKQATIKTVEELVAAGYIERALDSGDRRRRKLMLTPTGMAKGEEVGAAMRAPLARAFRQAGGEAVAGHDLVLAALCREGVAAEKGS